MAETEKNKSKSKSKSPSPLSGFLNRSFTTKYTSTTTTTTSDSNQPTYIFFKNQQSPNRVSSASKFQDSIDSVKGKVKKLLGFFEPNKTSSSSSNVSSPRESPPNPILRPTKSIAYSASFNSGFIKPTIRLPGTEDRIVIYLTSLRGIRRTYEDCYAVKMIFRGFRLWFDERDISMDAAYKKELQNILKVKNVTLPQVFIKGKYIGGADVIKSMFEMGELAKILDDFPRRQPGFVCSACGDVRFVPCAKCNGSRKVFDDDEGLLERCFECNENGLRRCPACCD